MACKKKKKKVSSGAVYSPACLKPGRNLGLTMFPRSEWSGGQRGTEDTRHLQ